MILQLIKEYRDRDRFVIASRTQRNECRRKSSKKQKRLPQSKWFFY